MEIISLSLSAWSIFGICFLAICKSGNFAAAATYQGCTAGRNINLNLNLISHISNGNYGERGREMIRMIIFCTRKLIWFDDCIAAGDLGLGIWLCLLWPIK